MIDYNDIHSNFMKGNLAPFYNRCYPGLLRYAVRILGDDLSWLAEDVVQDTVLMAYEYRNELRSVDKWRAWLLTGVRNSSIKLLNKANSRQNYISNVKPDEFQLSVEADLIEQETKDAFFEAVRSLPQRYHEIIQLSFIEGLKNSEVAERLNITEVAVRKRKFKLLLLLREKLGESDTLLILILLTSPFAQSIIES